MKNHIVAADCSSRDKFHQELCQDKHLGFSWERCQRLGNIVRPEYIHWAQNVANVVLPEYIQWAQNVANIHINMSARAAYIRV